MAFLTRLIKVSLVAAALAVPGLGVAEAATFKAKRGINLDIWITWPDERGR